MTMASVDTGAPGSVTRGARWRLTGSRWVRRLIVWGCLLGLYELAAMAFGPFFLPTVEAIARATVELAVEGNLFLLGTALLHMALGFGLAVVVGVLVGVAIGASRIVDYVLGMYVKALFVMSLVALLPLLIIVFGFGLTFRVAVVFLFSVFFIILNTAAGVRDIAPEHLELARSYRSSRIRTLWYVRLPAALPFVISGMRLGLANAFAGMILAELWVTRGIGLVLTQLGLNRELPQYFSLLMIVTLIAALSAAGLKTTERLLTPWGQVHNER